MENSTSREGEESPMRAARIDWRALAWGVVGNLLLALVCGLSARAVQVLFATVNERIIIFWPPVGLGLGALLLGGRRFLPGIFLGLLINGVHYGMNPWIAAGIALGDCLEVALVHALLTWRNAFDRSFSLARSFLNLVLASVAGALVGATLGVGTAGMGGRIPLEALPKAWLRWWMGDLMGIFLLVPAILLFVRRPVLWLSRGRLAEFLAFLLATFLVGQVIFLGWGPAYLVPYAKAYFGFLFVCFAAVRYGPQGVTVVLLMVAAQALGGAAVGRGFFAQDAAQTHLVNFWLYMVVLTVVGVTVASVIREQKLAEEMASAETSFKDQVLAGVPGGLLVFSPEGRILFSNTRAEALLGLPGWRLRKLTVWDPAWRLVREDLVPLPTEAYPAAQVLASGKPVWNQMLGLQRGKDEAPVWLLVNAFPELRADGTIAKVILMFLDISDRKAEEQERRRLEGILQQSQKMESLGTLSGGIAHDMNNVLGGIMMVASTLHVQLAGQSEAKGALETVLSACERGRDMVRKLLEFSRQDMEQPQSVDLNSLVRKELEILQHTTRQKVALEADLAPDLAHVFGEPSALAGGLMNLCVNALDAMPEGGVLSLRTRTLADGWVELAVSDTGCGMSTEIQARAFDPFFTTKPVGKGTGLGLAMLHTALKAHGATVEVQSQPGKGTTFFLRFPPLPVLQVQGPDTRTSPEPIRSRGSSPEVSGNLVLLVDDDPLMQETTPALLRVLGHSAEVLGSGEACLARLQEEPLPRVVILDHNMPGLTGLETLRILRSQGQSLPVVLASGFLDPEQEQELRGMPAVWVLRKPYGLKEMKLVLEQIQG